MGHIQGECHWETKQKRIGKICFLFVVSDFTSGKQN